MMTKANELIHDPSTRARTRRSRHLMQAWLKDAFLEETRTNGIKNKNEGLKNEGLASKDPSGHSRVKPTGCRWVLSSKSFPSRSLLATISSPSCLFQTLNTQVSIRFFKPLNQLKPRDPLMSSSVIIDPSYDGFGNLDDTSFVELNIIRFPFEFDRNSLQYVCTITSTRGMRHTMEFEVPRRDMTRESIMVLKSENKCGEFLEKTGKIGGFLLEGSVLIIKFAKGVFLSNPQVKTEDHCERNELNHHRDEFTPHKKTIGNKQ
ncbi:hypothetical protein M9H77_30631 [Catharanthus roseus]|uniref:Uncharacterized protein n=1 Tax=Catharanthus roseus TaxID=4058 RepID=A0ACB9ZZU7_CATRO|nr:hypothetical protein M9H77_30631 [Catharanthus roseus]